MTREEFTEIVKRFNEDKVKNNWLSLIKVGANHGWKFFKAKITNCPDYYIFETAQEFKYWLRHSDESNFVDRRFCSICGRFISTVLKRGTVYPIGCCKEHTEQARIKHIHETNVIRYGTVTPMKNKDIAKKVSVAWKRRTSEEKDKIMEKVKDTKEKKYGSGTYNNSEKATVTCLERYGCERPCKSEIIKNKMIQTNLQKYGHTSPTANKEIQKKVKKTKLERYSDENYNGREKAKETCIIKYGTDNPSKNDQIKEKITKNAISVRTKNGTLNTSLNFEEKMIKYLKETYPSYTILTQYSEDSRYPYLCDCYIKDLDLFIEFQGSYYHNYTEFLGLSEQVEEYERLKAKGGQKAAIAEVWRYKDPKKRETAKKNNLNYK